MGMLDKVAVVLTNFIEVLGLEAGMRKWEIFSNL